MVDLERRDGGSTWGALLQDTGEIIGKLETGDLQVSVGVRHNRLADADNSADPQDTIMSKQLQEMQKTSSPRSTNLLSTMRDSGPRSKRQADDLVANLKSKRPKATDANIVANQNGTKLFSKKDRGRGTRKVGNSPHNDDETGLASAMPSGTLGRNSSRKNSASLLSSKLAELLVHCYAIQNGVGGGAGNVFDQGLLATGIIRRKVRSDQVRCECGSRHTSDGMVGSPTITAAGR